MVHAFESGYVNLSVWGTFSARGRGNLIQLTGTLNQLKYKTILETYLLPFMKAYHSGDGKSIYQHDVCSAHRAKSVSAYLTENGMDVLPWPAQSPDLNPIENVWLIMKRRLRALHTYPSNRDALFAQLCKIWDELPDSYFNAPVSFMVTRCTSIRNSQGRSSKY